MIDDAKETTTSLTGPGGGPSRGSFLFAAVCAACVAFIPFLRLCLNGQSLYFRDLSVYFFPLRRFLLEGLAQGELRFWNPFAHEGEPIGLSAFGYLPDLLQLLLPNEFGMSLLLVLHVSFAAFGFVWLGRELGVRPLAAVAGAVIYALGGFALSTLNLYVYVLALAWAPFFILGFRRGVQIGGARPFTLAALALGMMISTAGLEIALQACLAAVVLTPPATRVRFIRSAGVALLGLGLSAASVFPVLALARGGERGAGFSTSAVLNYSMHPMALLQVLISGLFGETSNLTALWWGDNFFPQGFPYFLSLYLGPIALSLAFVGMMTAQPMRRRLAALLMIGVVVALGQYAGLGAVLDQLPGLRFLRFPVKAFYTVALCVAVLASFGMDAVVRGVRPHIRQFGIACTALGVLLASLRFLPSVAPALAVHWLDRLTPPHITWAAQRGSILQLVTADALAGGMAAIACGIVCLLTLRNLLKTQIAVIAVLSLLSADLIRGGVGLNPGVTSAFYETSPSMERMAGELRTANGRAFTCEQDSSASFWRERTRRGMGHEAFTMATMQETFVPNFNLNQGVRTALSPDATGLIDPRRTLPAALAGCASIDAAIPALRAASVNRVISLDPLSHPNLRPLSDTAPPRLTPMAIHLYELDGALPRFSQPVAIAKDSPGDLRFSTRSQSSATLTIGDAYAPGWTATVNGSAQAVTQTGDGHMQLSVPAGESEIIMHYEPAGLKAGLGLTSISLAICVMLLLHRPVRQSA